MDKDEVKKIVQTTLEKNRKKVAHVKTVVKSTDYILSKVGWRTTCGRLRTTGNFAKVERMNCEDARDQIQQKLKKLRPTEVNVGGKWVCQPDLCITAYDNQVVMMTRDFEYPEYTWVKRRTLFE